MSPRPSRVVLVVSCHFLLLPAMALAGRALLASTPQARAHELAFEASTTIDPAVLQVAPSVGPPRRYDWAAQAWAAAGAEDSGAAETTVYDNTCLSSLGAVWLPTDPCVTWYDQGLLPGTGNPKAGAGATDTNLISEFTFGYCTTNPGPVDLEILFWSLGDWTGGSIPVAGPPVASFRMDTLPGVNAGETESCHQITVDLGAMPFCLPSDGDGSWENSASTDLFTWGFVSHTGLADTGPLIAGDKTVGGSGNCTYSNPCSGCGTGLGTLNGFWQEESVPGCTGSGSTFHWFGGFPWASFSMSLDSYGDCASCSVPTVSYCTAGTSASGCQALLSSTGTPSATASSGFHLTASSVEGLKDGLFFFGANGRQANPWGTGTSYQCVVTPVIRGGLIPGSGTVGLCDGAFDQDLNALWCPSCPRPAKNPGAGATLQAQLWYRDPFNTGNQTTSLSDALEFYVCP